MGMQAPVILAVTDRETRDKLSKLNFKYDIKRRPDPFCGAPVVLCVVVPKADPTGVEDGIEILKSVGLDDIYMGVGNCVLGYPEKENNYESRLSFTL